VAFVVLTRATWCCIPEDGILHSHCHENLITNFKMNMNKKKAKKEGGGESIYQNGTLE
jgi:hypothetical protein